MYHRSTERYTGLCCWPNKKWNVQVFHLCCFFFFRSAFRRAIWKKKRLLNCKTFSKKKISSFLEEVQLTCLSLKERLPFVLTFWLCLIIMKFLVLLFSLLLVLACGFSLVRFFTNSFRSLLPAWNNRKHTIKNKQNMKPVWFTRHLWMHHE